MKKNTKRIIKVILAVVIIAIEAKSQMVTLYAADYTMTDEEIAEEMYYDSLETLAICVEAEAGGESELGKRMVCDVILNRVDTKEWKNDIFSVISTPYEFSSYWDGGMNKVIEPSKETFEAVSKELKSRTYSDIYYFTAGRYSFYGTPWKQVGNHYFSKK